MRNEITILICNYSVDQRIYNLMINKYKKISEASTKMKGKEIINKLKKIIISLLRYFLFFYPSYLCIILSKM